MLVCVRPLTVSAHALSQALLQTAVLAAVAAGPVDLTVALPGAGVGHGGQLAAPEKALVGEQSEQRPWFFKADTCSGRLSQGGLQTGYRLSGDTVL